MQQNNEIYEAFFQQNAGYYIDKLEKFRRGRRFTFNLYVFLFGFFWFFYRRMYSIAALLLSILVVESMLESYLIEFVADEFLKKMISYASTILIWTGTAFIANYLYILRANAVVRTIASEQLSDEEALRRAGKKGGTSLLFVVIVVGVIIFLVLYNNQIANN